MPRPVKLTDDVQKRIISALRIGATHDHAARAAGVHADTFRRWMRAGERATRGQFYALCVAVKKAEAEAAVGWLATIERAAHTGIWQAAAWKLERRYPEQWGRRDRLHVEHSGEVQLRQVIEARTVIMQALTTFPDARLAVADALEQLDTKQQAEAEQEGEHHGHDR